MGAAGSVTTLPVEAQEAPAVLPDTSVGTAATQSPAEEEDLQVFLITYGQGDQIWEPFGHNALWFRDRRTGTDIAFDWGVFSFDAEFLPRFLRGTMMYGMAANDPLRAAEYYESVNRSVGVQELALTPEQARDLYQRVRENYEDPLYRYDYFVDNCSTRIRDMLDSVTGGAIRDAVGAIPEETYRFHTRRLTQHNLPLWAGLDLLLGNPGSNRITRWDALFTPLELEEALREVQVPAPGGGKRPLVASERMLSESDRPPEPEAPAGFHWVFLLLGLGLGGAFLLLGRSVASGSKGAGIVFWLLGTFWSLLVGIIGVVLVLVWFTDHVWMYWNENLLQFSPLSLVLLAFLPAAVWGTRAGRAAKWARVVAGVAVLGFVVQVLPGLDQGNGELIAMALPAHLGLALGLIMIAGDSRGTAPGASN